MNTSKKTWCIVIILISTFVLLAVNALVSVWSMAAVGANDSSQLYTPILHISKQNIITGGIWAACGIALISFAVLINTRQLLNASSVIFLFSLILSILALFDDDKAAQWITVANRPIFAPLLGFLFLPFLSYQFSIYRCNSFRRIFLVSAFTVLIPAVLYAFLMKSPGPAIISNVSFLALLIKLVLDKRLSHPLVVIGLYVLLLLLPIGNCIIGGITHGAEGLFEIGQVPLIGETVNSITVNGKTIHAYLYFANQDPGYAMTALVLKYGWITLLVTLGAPVALVVSLFRLSSSAKNSAARYSSFCIAVFFAARIVGNTISCFAGIEAGIWLPFGGCLSAATIDLFLCSYAAILCVKTDDSALYLLDLEPKNPPAGRVTKQ